MFGRYLKAPAIVADFQPQPIGCPPHLAVNLLRPRMSQGVPDGFAYQPVNGGCGELFKWLGIGGKIEFERGLIGA